MAIQPIDLQVLFSRLDQVGKEQAAQKDVTVHHQAVQGSEIVKRTEHQDHSVSETRQVEQDGVRKIGEDKKKRSSPRRSQGESGKKEDEDDAKREVLRDPFLGRNIDITG